MKFTAAFLPSLLITMMGQCEAATSWTLNANIPAGAIDDIEDFSRWTNGFPGPGNPGTIAAGYSPRTTRNITITMWGTDPFRVYNNLSVISTHSVTFAGTGRFLLGTSSSTGSWSQRGGSLSIGSGIPVTLANSNLTLGNSASTASASFLGATVCEAGNVTTLHNGGSRLYLGGSLRLEGGITFSRQVGQTSDASFPRVVFNQPQPLTLGTNSRLLLTSGSGLPLPESFQEYILFEGFSSVSGQFGTVTGLPTGFDLILDHSAGKIVLRKQVAANFDSWSQSSGLTGPNAAAEATPFGDGVPNLLKFAFNMNGAGPDTSRLVAGSGTSGLPAFGMAGTTESPVIQVQYLRRKNSDLVYTPKVSSDLAPNSFVPMASAGVATSIDANWERVTVTQSIDPSVTPKWFTVVEVTKQ